MLYGMAFACAFSTKPFFKAMKNLFLVLATGLLFTTGAAHAQGSDIPATVVNHFKAKYPAAEKTDYDKESTGYEVEFYLDGVKWEAYYDTRGNWVKTERDVTRADVPDAVWTALSSSSYGSWKVDDIEEHQTPRHERVYEIEVKGKAKKAYLYFLPDGKMVK